MSQTAVESKQAKLEKEAKLHNKIMWVPIILLLAAIPLLVRLAIVQFTTDDMALATALKSSYVTDFFSQYKAGAIMMMSIVMVIMLFLLFRKEWIKKDKYILTYGVCSIVFVGMSLISTIASNYSSVAWSGTPDRQEGMFMTLCYFLMLLYTIYIFNKTNQYKYIVLSLSVLIAISTFIGAFQYFGYDLVVNAEWMQRLVIPSDIRDQVQELSGIVEDGRIYGTMFHYNYMGSFGAMMVPLFGILTIFIPGKKNKAFLGLVTVLAMFLLFGSTSRAGLIGLICAGFMGIIVLGKKIIKKWKITLPIVVAFAVILLGFNMMTSGAIFERIPTLVNDALALVTGGDSEFDYKDHIPVRDVIEKDGTVTIVLQNDSLTIVPVEGGAKLVDSEGNDVPYTYTDENYVTEDPRFSHVTFEMGDLTAAEGEVADKGIRVSVDGISAFTFRVDPEQGIYPIDPFSEERIEIVDAPAVGFKGKEKLGSARGYIWSRSIPLVKKHLLLGSGPDTYILEFPQDDILAKWWAYDTPNMIVDKPHNLYLQFAINNGGVALLAFLVIVGLYIIDSLRLYALKSTYSNEDAIGVATMLAIVGYLGAGFFNDSIVSVAPIFWILLGAGIAINYINRKSKRELLKRVEHATVSMKTRKHLA